MKKTLGIILTSFLATAAVIKAAPALAQAQPLLNVSIVQTADLNLSTHSGRAVLDHRLVTAAYEVCGYAIDADLVGLNSVRQCRVDVLTRARSEAQQIASRNTNGSILVAANR